MYHRGEEMSGGRMRKRRVKFQVYLFFWVDFARFYSINLLSIGTPREHFFSISTYSQLIDELFTLTKNQFINVTNM